MNKILVTGATGLLGTTLSKHLISSGYNIHTHSKSNSSDSIFDLTNTTETIKNLDFINPDVIINLVGMTNVDQCELNPSSAYLTNCKSVENIVHWISTYKKYCFLIHISTDHIYDGLGPHTEDKILISNIYSITKYAAELATSKIDCCILRTNFFGKSECFNRISFTDWIYKSYLENNKIQLFKDIYFSPLSIHTLVDILELLIKIKPIGVFNLGSNNGLSKAEFGLLFIKYLNFDSNFVTLINSTDVSSSYAKRPKDMRMNSAKFEHELKLKLPSLNNEIFKIHHEYRI